ncbi:MAG: hypothetical protein R3A79_26130 [Nannocystaceae bacterium]
MRRPELWCLGLSLALLAPLGACGQPGVAPTKQRAGEAPTRITPPERAAPKDPASPFRNPSTEAPPPRSEAQVDDARLAELLGEADAMREKGDTAGAVRVLRECANKVPASARCEGELGMLLLEYERRRAECRYYLAEAARADDARPDAEFYGRLGAALREQGMHEDAATAFQRRLDRGATQASDYVLLSEALQGVAGREEAAADALAEAFKIDPTQIRLLKDEGVLRGQVPGQAKRAAELLREYLGRVGDGDEAAKLEARIAELEATAKMEGAARKPGDAGSPGSAPT